MSTKHAAGTDVATAGPQSLDHDLGVLLMRAMTISKDHFVSALAEMDLTLPQGMALHFLEEDQPMRELAAQMGHDASHITGIIDKLEARGLVERRADPHDRRIKRLVVTPAGEELRRRIEERVLDRHPLVTQLTTSERGELRRLLSIALDPVPTPSAGPSGPAARPE